MYPVAKTGLVIDRLRVGRLGPLGLAWRKAAGACGHVVAGSAARSKAITGRLVPVVST
jgi:hypothetical protein